jgi:hypothetical protein
MDAYAARESGILPYVDASRAQRYRSILHWALSVARAAAGIHAVEAVRRSGAAYAGCALIASK